MKYNHHIKWTLLVLFINVSTSLAITNRAYEPVIMTGEPFIVFEGARLKNVVAFQYDASTESWTQAAMQIDDRWSNGTLAFSNRDSVFQHYDEVLFLAGEFGDMAPATQWIVDESSKQYPRVQIMATDPVTGITGYLYIFRTDSPQLHTNSIDYVSYTYDKIIGHFYEVDHSGTEGIFNSLKIKSTMDGNELNFVDRLKLRMRVVYDLPWPLSELSFMATENNFRQNKTDIIQGSIRVIRKWWFDIDVPDDYDPFVNISTKDYTMVYYPTSCNMGQLDQIKLPSGLTTNYFRFSVDMNSNANAMSFCSNNNPDAVPINHSMSTEDNNISRNLNAPGRNWWLQTGNAGSLLSIAYVPDISNTTESLYYRDATSGVDDSPMGGSDAKDTSSDGSWGDAGVKFYSTRQQSVIPGAGLWFYFLGPNITPDSAATIESFLENPITENNWNTEQQNYVDGIAPAKVADLHITNVGDNSITLAWTAPGDDGSSNGPATQYQIRYSLSGRFYSIAQWWSAATPLSNLPTPLEPGQTQTFTVTGLDNNKAYLFGLRALDENGNVSEYSNLTGQSTTPVELSAFTAQFKDKQVVLQWTTATETNNLGFAIERKANDGKEWDRIGFVTGGGTRTTPANYTFRDADVSGLQEISYRLKQTDTDGTWQYSKEVTVNVHMPDQLILLPNYPNPFNPSTRIEYQLPANISGHVELAIYDVLGRRIRTLVEKSAKPGYFQVVWNGVNDNGQPVSSGEYFCVLRVGSLQQIQKMIKLQ